MKIITVSREFGSGGREIGRRLADRMKFDYYDNEIITAVAKDSGMNMEYVENKLEDHGWQSFPVTYRGTLSAADYVQFGDISLLLQQKKVIEKIADMGKDFVIVGRNADIILASYNPFNLFICAETDAKIKRCMERKSPDENLTEKELLRKMRQVDKMRAKTRAMMSDSEWGQRDAYHLTVNTTDWNIKELAEAIAEFANRRFGGI